MKGWINVNRFRLIPRVIGTKNLPPPARMEVLPLPKTSQAMPNRGAMLFQRLPTTLCGTPGSPGNKQPRRRFRKQSRLPAGSKQHHLAIFGNVAVVRFPPDSDVQGEPSAQAEIVVHEQSGQVLPYPRCQPSYLPVGIEFAQQEIGRRVAGLRAGEGYVASGLPVLQFIHPIPVVFKAEAQRVPAVIPQRRVVDVRGGHNVARRRPGIRRTKPEMPSVDCGVSPKPVLVLAMLIGRPSPVSEKSFLVVRPKALRT